MPLEQSRLIGNHRQPAALCLHFLCSYSYFFPLDMILIVSCQPQQLNSLVRPLQSPLLCCSLGRRGHLTLPISPVLSEILAPVVDWFPCRWFDLFQHLLRAMIVKSWLHHCHPFSFACCDPSYLHIWITECSSLRRNVMYSIVQYFYVYVFAEVQCSSFFYD